jgi:hypothetical protein
MRYTARYSVPDGTIEEAGLVIDAKCDDEARTKARLHAEKLSRSGTVTWELRGAGGRRITR